MAAATLVYRLCALTLLASALVFALVFVSASAESSGDGIADEGSVRGDDAAAVDESSFYLPGGSGSWWSRYADAEEAEEYNEKYNLTVDAERDAAQDATTRAPEPEAEAAEAGGTYGARRISSIRGKRANRQTGTVRAPWWFFVMSGESDSGEGDSSRGDETTTVAAAETASTSSIKAGGRPQPCICIAEWNPVCALAVNVTYSNMCFFDCADEGDTSAGFSPGECSARSVGDDGADESAEESTEEPAPWWCFWCTLEIDLPDLSSIFTFGQPRFGVVDIDNGFARSR